MGRRVWLGCCIVALLAVSGLVAEAQQAVFVVRHAERQDDSQDSALSEAGVRRAELLASLLKDAGITAIYVSDLQRTIKTAEPLAKALKIEMKRVAQYEDKDMDTLVAALRSRHAQDRVLIVGHSNTMPALMKGLGDPDGLKLGRDEYNLLLLLVPRGDARPAVLRLRF
ncbi:MAG TPA: phosphoglycerate mutase family protein [Methylomirabilota bacterium]|nr:phosphoglycerate mutase family protein [Methylomirabilota bacterium]